MNGAQLVQLTILTTDFSQKKMVSPKYGTQIFSKTLQSNFYSPNCSHLYIPWSIASFCFSYIHLELSTYMSLTGCQKCSGDLTLHRSSSLNFGLQTSDAESFHAHTKYSLLRQFISWHLTESCSPGSDTHAGNADTWNLYGHHPIYLLRETTEQTHTVPSTSGECLTSFLTNYTAIYHMSLLGRHQ